MTVEEAKKILQDHVDFIGSLKKIDVSESNAEFAEAIRIVLAELNEFQYPYICNCCLKRCAGDNSVVISETGRRICFNCFPSTWEAEIMMKQKTEKHLGEE